MSLKSTAIKFATKKAIKNKKVKKVVKTATISSVLLGGSFLTLLLATEGKRQAKEKSSEN